jgi:hypothetical protein
MLGTLPGGTGINHANLLQHFSYRSFRRGHAVEDSQLIASKYFRTLPEFTYNAKEKAKMWPWWNTQNDSLRKIIVGTSKSTHFLFHSPIRSAEHPMIMKMRKFMDVPGSHRDGSKEQPASSQTVKETSIVIVRPADDAGARGKIRHAGGTNTFLTLVDRVVCHGAHAHSIKIIICPFRFKSVL